MRLKEEEPAEIFEVSRARVRQVPTLLASDGLVTIVPNRGTLVSEPTAQEAQDIFHVRKLVEDRIIERLAGRMTAADFARLEALRAGDCVTAQAAMRKHLENVESEPDLSNGAGAVRDRRGALNVVSEVF